MNHAAYAINLFDQDKGCDLSTASFADLTANAVWGAQLNMHQDIVATHQELALLRQCAKHTLSNSQYVVHVISSESQQQTYYLVKTLLHLGVSCGKIIVRSAATDSECPEGVWLFVEDISTAN